MPKEKENKDQNLIINHIGVAAAQTEVVQRYGSAIKEQYVAYSGIDNETGKVLSKGLKQISESTVNPDYAAQNIKQQAGYAAEVKTVARENAEKIIARDPTRSVRTDDIKKGTTANGTPIGGVNDQLFDLVSIDEDGSFVEGTARQLKYVGSDAKSCCNKLTSKKFDKYRDANASMEVPKDLYDDVAKELDDRITTLRKQIETAEKRGEFGLSQKHRAQLERAQRTRESLKRGALTKDEACMAKLHPELSTAIDVVGYSHRAGVEGAQMGAVVSGGMSLIRNCVSVIKGDRSPEEAVLAVAGDTASGAALSYVTSFAGSAIKGALQNAKQNWMNQLANSSVPAMIATAVLETGKTLYRFADGQIDGTQCLMELGEKGAGIVASSIGAAIGQIAIPIPVVGGLIGSMVGYALSSLYYNALTSTLQEAKLAHQERLKIEAECEASIAYIREYRVEMEIAIRNYFSHHLHSFYNAFAKMQETFHTGNVDFLIEGMNDITETLGGEVLFHNIDEFDELMKSRQKIII